ncbi:MAG: dipeptide ABC transporter ATP-binding protein [Rhizobiaceae bacterium]
MTADVLKVEGLTVALPPSGQRAHAVENIDFALRRGETLCMVGESGSGKSVVAHAVMGLLPANLHLLEGRVLLEGKEIQSLSERDFRRIRGRKLSMVFQEPMTALNPLMRVGDQISEAMRVHGISSQTLISERLYELAEQVRLPDPASTLSAYPMQLSGGQRQRVMIAMALALRPALLIADEPTTALDVTTQAQILSIIKGMQQAYGTGVLFVTHDFGVVAEIADRVIVMEKGNSVEAGAVVDILERPTHPYTRRLIAAVPDLGVRDGRKPDVPPAPALEIKGLSKRFVRRAGPFARRTIVDAVRNIDLSVNRGEIFGVIGESGSGKSTLGRLIVRLVNPDSGDILIDGVNMAHLDGRAMRTFRPRVQMVFQDPFGSLNPRQTVGDILCNVPALGTNDGLTAKKEATRLLELVGLDARALDRFPHEFSGGQRQRISLARALATNPTLLIADEAVSALDVIIQAQILDLIADLRRRLQLTVLFITHDLRIAGQICDRVAVMLRGEVVEQGRPEDIFASPQHTYTARLIASIPGRGRRGEESAAEQQNGKETVR